MNLKNKKNHPSPVLKTPPPAEVNELIQAINSGKYAAGEALALALTIGYPDIPFVWEALVVVLERQGKGADALAPMQKVAQLRPHDAEVFFNMGTLLRKLGHLDEAETALRQAIGLRPNYAEAHNNLGNVLLGLGRLDESLRSYQRAIKFNPDYKTAYGNLLAVCNYVAEGSPLTYKAEAERYGELVAKQRTIRYREWHCSKFPVKLRLGFVSGDLLNHSVAYFLESLLTKIDTSRFELFAYVTQPVEDSLTKRIKPFFVEWRDVFSLKDEAAAKMIYADALHLLIDLSGHTAHNRLPVFAYKPAPIQATWLGYFATTGVADMDYWLADPFVIPVTEEDHFTEGVWRLPETYLCFTPPPDQVEIHPLPALTQGCLTFGCFNNLIKMNDAVVTLWSNVLRAIPNSRLFLKTKQLDDQLIVEKTLTRFSLHGISGDRLILEGHSPRAELLASYNRVDIALDPFPYPGGTTTAEALWMGVPVLTRCGDRFLSHVGESIAHNTGQSVWTANDDDDYIKKAVKFSADLAGLARLRMGLREQVLVSPLFNAPRFSRHFESAMWGMWNEWRSQKERIK